MLDPETGDIPRNTPGVNGLYGGLRIAPPDPDLYLPLAEEIADPPGPRDATAAELAAWDGSYPPPWVPEKRARAGTCPNRSGA